jgi:hypothetical protein
MTPLAISEGAPDTLLRAMERRMEERETERRLS